MTHPITVSPDDPAIAQVRLQRQYDEVVALCAEMIATIQLPKNATSQLGEPGMVYLAQLWKDRLSDIRAVPTPLPPVPTKED